MAKNITIRTGEKHHAWKGNELGYAAAHSWLRTHHYDNKKQCEQCPATANLHFAKRHGRPYSRDIKDYLILCQSCHLKYDGNFNRPPWNKGRQTVAPKKCELCPKEFRPAKPQRRFCSNSCSSKYKAMKGITKPPVARLWLALKAK